VKDDIIAEVVIENKLLVNIKIVTNIHVIQKIKLVITEKGIMGRGMRLCVKQNGEK
jgi:hypothetical protein